ncbi:MAG: HAMP domain-containing protein [Deltaproteobacteria bacterium]|nr:HAMP domain-containing protein [Deltaproteobacteria bacterium]
MRITVKQQVLMAPATVLLLLILLLGFMQYTYWNLSKIRQQSKAIGTTFVALAEADMVARRLQVIIRTFQYTGIASPEDMALVADLYDRLLAAIDRIEPFGPLKTSNDLEKLRSLADKINPSDCQDPEQTAELFARFRARLSNLSNTTQIHRNKLRHLHTQDINLLIARTVQVTIVVIGLAILLGLFLATYFSRRILGRIQQLSDNAGRIAAGDLELPPAPEQIRDELDTLAVSINRMTTRLIQVVGTEKLLEGAEEERRRIAMDLHDQTLSDLSTVLRGLQTLGTKAPDQETSHSITTLEQDLSRAITNLRDIMENLHPQTLDILGLGAAIEAHLDRHCCTDGLPEYHLYIDPRVSALNLNRVQQLTLYRIVIEAIQNVLKHAEATRYEVNLELREQLLVMSVEDNGKGIDQGVYDGNGRGLNNIRERARAIGAKVEWNGSRFSSGTRFELTLPTS